MLHRDRIQTQTSVSRLNKIRHCERPQGARQSGKNFGFLPPPPAGAGLASLPRKDDLWFFQNFHAETSLVILGDNGPFHFVAFVQEAEFEGEVAVAENLRVLGPG